MQLTTTADPALKAMTAMTSRFFRRGLIIALVSGMLYGLYSAFLTQGMSVGPWATWYAPDQTLLTAFVVVYVLGMLGSGVNDLISAVWMVGIAGVKGKFLDVLRCLKSKPGAVMAVCALIGGPVANGAYIIALQMIGPMAATITALCPTIGAIIGRLLFKQPLNLRMGFGIVICLIAAGLTSTGAFTGVTVNTTFLLGVGIAFIAALGWGIEGAVAGFGTSVMDYEISISIRQTVSGLSTLLVAVPVLALIGGHLAQAPHLTIAALTSAQALPWFILSGLCAGLSFGLWYKGNSMSGAALGMACNGTYAFWVPLFCWIILGLILRQDGWSLSWLNWFSALLMVVGIFLIAVNPMAWLRRQPREA